MLCYGTKIKTGDNCRRCNRKGGAAADNDDFEQLETGKSPPNGHTSPKRKTPKARQSPAGNGFVHVEPEEGAKQN